MYCVNAQWVEGGVYLHRAVEQFGMLVKLFCHEIANHLTFEFITMGSRDYTHPPVSFPVFNNVFPYREPLVYG